MEKAWQYLKYNQSLSFLKQSSPSRQRPPSHSGLSHTNSQNISAQKKVSRFQISMLIPNDAITEGKLKFTGAGF